MRPCRYGTGDTVSDVLLRGRTGRHGCSQMAEPENSGEFRPTPTSIGNTAERRPSPAPPASVQFPEAGQPQSEQRQDDRKSLTHPRTHYLECSAGGIRRTLEIGREHYAYRRDRYEMQARETPSASSER